MAPHSTRQAVALNYTPGPTPPRVVAKGDGDFADEIVAIARENGVPIHEDPALVAVLSRLDLNEQIPSRMFEAVAAVFAFIYRLQAEQDAAANP